MNYFGFDDVSVQGRTKSPESYVIWEPSEPLKKWVQCFWMLTVPAGSQTFRGVPGNNIDCIFHAPCAERINFAVMPLCEPALFEMKGPITFFGIR